MRQALEKSYTKENLQKWVDLVFGYKQKDKEAEEGYNLFCSSTYSQIVREKVESEKGNPCYAQELGCLKRKVAEFGQVPSQLFTKTLKKPKIKDMQAQILETFSKVNNFKKTLLFESNFDIISCMSYTNAMQIDTHLFLTQNKQIIFIQHQQYTR